MSADQAEADCFRLRMETRRLHIDFRLPRTRETGPQTCAKVVGQENDEMHTLGRWKMGETRSDREEADLIGRVLAGAKRSIR